MHLNQNLKANLKTSKDWIISFDVFVMYIVIGDVSTDDKGFRVQFSAYFTFTFMETKYQT